MTLGDVMRAYKAVAETEDGRTMIQDLVKRFGWSRQSMLSSDPLQLAWREGGRAVMVHIGRMIDGNPDEADEANKRAGEG